MRWQERRRHYGVSRERVGKKTEALGVSINDVRSARRMSRTELA